MGGVTVFVRLLDEGTEVFRPVRVEREGERAYRLVVPPDFDGEEERWEFAPGSLVVCERQVRRQ